MDILVCRKKFSSMQINLYKNWTMITDASNYDSFDLFQPHLRNLANRYTRARDTTRARDRCSLVYCIWIPQMAYRSPRSILPIPCGSTCINGWPSWTCFKMSRLSLRLINRVKRSLSLTYQIKPRRLTKFMGFEIYKFSSKKENF